MRKDEKSSCATRPSCAVTRASERAARRLDSLSNEVSSRGRQNPSGNAAHGIHGAIGIDRDTSATSVDEISRSVGAELSLDVIDRSRGTERKTLL